MFTCFPMFEGRNQPCSVRKTLSVTPHRIYIVCKKYTMAKNVSFNYYLVLKETADTIEGDKYKKNIMKLGI